MRYDKSREAGRAGEATEDSEGWWGEGLDSLAEALNAEQEQWLWNREGGEGVGGSVLGLERLLRSRRPP